ncbi:MAG: hypothetical protein LAP86_06730 [Acidobacteriia bacterium]|nr:hypothetical protein [Terriglobia bacterium]
MAIVFAYNVMVARKSEIGAKYPGGLAQFRSDWVTRPGRWREDEHLLVQSSMGGSDFRDVTERLNALGVDVLLTDQSVPPDENVKRCEWLDWDVYKRWEFKLPNGFVQTHKVARHWLRGTEPGDTAEFTSRR